MARHSARHKIFYILLLLYNNYEPIPTGKMPKKRKNCGFGFGVGLGFS
ncbi:hypothetical protein [Microcystis aeruginosa]|uniref:Uncharacterized protein n=1 Tax=Microcystis aeruginosa NIES-44 TaxID=449439 RepID=A0A0A1W2J5_MICAE|nr:hypothetical protein [Microcystis aeruginosa]GAL95933.1 hypothetical protein N44_04789 [Microcystis aeruginosa NIES-44]